MLNVQRRIILWVVVASAVLAGCDTAVQEAGSEGAVSTYRTLEFRDLPEDIHDQFLAFRMASEISSNCGGIYISNLTVNRANEEIARILEFKGHIDVDEMRDNLQKSFQEYYTSYLKENGIVSREGLCDAGRKEIADQSQIGKFLKG
ncbi:DUF5333 family protein [Roseobacter litoralis]|uniref:DUF5333 family protein n=1 Tax=Roseobacter litoralis TaxID=42443 RepID=UPI002490A5CD|nr:DUF5333 family protein [Roseobacter litoralis]